MNRSPAPPKRIVLWSPILWAIAWMVAPVGARLSAQETTISWPAGVETRVRALVAERTGEPQESIVLDWASEAPAELASSAAVELLGGGRGGYWVVRVEGAADTTAIRLRTGLVVTRLVAARRVERGEALAPADITPRTEVVWGGAQHLETAAQPGWVAQRVLQAGDALASPAVRAPLAITSGDPVRLVWTRGAVTVEATGVAAGSAPLGGLVHARSSSGARLTGIAVAPGIVNITPEGIR